MAYYYFMNTCSLWIRSDFNNFNNNNNNILFTRVRNFSKCVVSAFTRHMNKPGSCRFCFRLGKKCAENLNLCFLMKFELHIILKPEQFCRVVYRFNSIHFHSIKFSNTDWPCALSFCNNFKLFSRCEIVSPKLPFS